jgi:hypothetical protein
MAMFVGSHKLTGLEGKHLSLVSRLSKYLKKLVLQLCAYHFPPRQQQHIVD